CGGTKKPARARARHLHGAQRASATCRAGRPCYGDARGETPEKQGYTGAAGNRLLVAARGGDPADVLRAILTNDYERTAFDSYPDLWLGSSGTKNRSTQPRLPKSAASAPRGC